MAPDEAGIDCSSLRPARRLLVLTPNPGSESPCCLSADWM